MLNILIPTQPDDAHALYVKLALAHCGHSADLWYTADFPTQQMHTFALSNGARLSRWMTGKDVGIRCQHYDIVWNRRPAKPILPSGLHTDDVDNAKRECLAWYQNLWLVLLPDAIWINPWDAAARSAAKLWQLQVAALVGFHIPNTLVSNHPQAIAAFIANKRRPKIYKTLQPMVWMQEDAVNLTYTQVVGVEDLPSAAVLQATPGIFQECIRKKYELRVTYFGERAVAVKIDSQACKAAQMDWRAAPTHELDLSEVRLPDAIHQRCLMLMKRLKLRMGCFDFIVTPEDEYYFLEINEQGQFLWIEEVNPEIRMLAAFVKYIDSFVGFRPLRLLPDIQLQDFAGEVALMKQRAMLSHQRVI